MSCPDRPSRHVRWAAWDDTTPRSSRTAARAADLYAELFREILDVIEVADDEGPTLRVTAAGSLAELVIEASRTYELVPVAEDLFALREPGTRSLRPVSCCRLASGASYVHFQGRAMPRAT